MRVAELGHRHDPARHDVLTHRRTEARTARAGGAYQESRSRRGAEPRSGTHRGQRQRTGFEPFLIAAVLGLILWALILTPFFI